MLDKSHLIIHRQFLVWIWIQTSYFISLSERFPSFLAVDRDVLEVCAEDLGDHGSAGSPEGETAAHRAAPGWERPGAGRVRQGNQPYLRGGKRADGTQGPTSAGVTHTYKHNTICAFHLLHLLTNINVHSPFNTAFKLLSEEQWPFLISLSVCNRGREQPTASPSRAGKHTERQNGTGQSAWRREKVQFCLCIVASDILYNSILTFAVVQFNCFCLGTWVKGALKKW